MKRILTISLLLLAVICTVSADRRRLLGVRNVAAGATSPTPEILWWKLNEGSGTSITGDGSNGGDDGTTDASWLTGKSGSLYCTDYNGTDDGTQSNAAITYGVATITVCAWVYLDATTDGMIWESSELYTSNPNSFDFLIFGGQLYAAIQGTSGLRLEHIAVPSTGSWKHLAVVYFNTTNNGDVKFYVDGAEQVSTTDTNTKADNANFATEIFNCGSRNQTGLFMNGRIDDLRIYSGDQSASLGTISADAQ